jgi:hypothetical protein
VGRLGRWKQKREQAQDHRRQARIEAERASKTARVSGEVGPFLHADELVRALAPVSFSAVSAPRGQRFAELFAVLTDRRLLLVRPSDPPTAASAVRSIPFADVVGLPHRSDVVRGSSVNVFYSQQCMRIDLTLTSSATTGPLAGQARESVGLEFGPLWLSAGQKMVDLLTADDPDN